MKRLLQITVLIPLFTIQNISSQSIKGIITSKKSKTPIAYANVILSDDNNNVISGVISSENGSYQINLKSGNYKVAFSFLGYKKEEISISIKSNENIIKNIELTEELNQLDEIVLTSEKTVIKQLPDKKVIYVGKDLMSSGGNALNVLEQLPEIQTEADGSIRLRGNKDVPVFLNNKPTSLSTQELLQQISSNEIVSIEVITSPSSKYRANGLTGFINIITRKKISKGIQLAANTNINSLGSAGLFSNFTMGSSKYGYRIRLSRNKRIIQNKNVSQRFETSPFSQENDFELKSKTSNISFGIDKYSKRNEFSFAFNYIQSDNETDNQSEIFQNQIVTLQNIKSDAKHTTLDINSNYRYTPVDSKNYIEVDFRLSNNKSNLNSLLTPIIEVQNNTTLNDVFILDVSVDSEQEFYSNLKLNSGLLFNSIELKNNRSFFNSEQLIESKESFENINRNYAGYTSLTLKTKNLTLQTGIRGEIFTRKALFPSQDLRISQQYLDFFPSFHINYEVDKNQNLNLGISRRTFRPTLQQVNPIQYQINEFSINKGNTRLKPEFSYNLDLSYQYDDKVFTFTPSFSLNSKSNIIVYTNEVDDSGVNTLEPINIEGSLGAFFDLSLGLKPYKWYRNSLSLQWSYDELIKNTTQFKFDYNKTFAFSFKNYFKISSQTNFTITLRQNGNGTFHYYTRKSKPIVDLGFQQKVFKNKGQVSLRISDLFNKREYNGTRYGSDYSQSFTFNPRYRIVFLSFSYRTKKGKLKRRSQKHRNYKSGVIN